MRDFREQSRREARQLGSAQRVSRRLDCLRRRAQRDISFIIKYNARFQRPRQRISAAPRAKSHGAAAWPCDAVAVMTIEDMASPRERLRSVAGARPR